MLDLFAAAGVPLAASARQRDFPEHLFAVRMYGARAGGGKDGG